MICRNCESPGVRVVSASSAKPGLPRPQSMAVCVLCGETWGLGLASNR